MANSKHFTSPYDMCIVAVFTAMICILAQISIPVPTGIPFTLQTFAITLTAIVLGKKKAVAAVLIYLLLGVVGIPVFANFKGGLQSLIGPTGGFLFSFPLMAFLIGLGAEKDSNKPFFYIMVFLGIFCNYLIGLLFYCFSTTCSLLTGFFTCVLPFLPSGLIMVISACFLGKDLRKRLP